MNNRAIIDRYYRAHKDDVLAFVSIRMHHSDDAEDLVQEVFLRLLSGERPISEATLPSLVQTLCRNMVVDWYRRRTVRQDYAHELACRQNGGETAETVLSMRETTELLERGLLRVAEDCRELYRLHIYGGMKTADICQLTGMPYKTVEYRLGMARKQVRNYLKHIS